MPDVDTYWLDARFRAVFQSRFWDPVIRHGVGSCAGENEMQWHLRVAKVSTGVATVKATSEKPMRVNKPLAINHMAGCWWN
jgi:hypothetical protein